MLINAKSYSSLISNFIFGIKNLCFLCTFYSIFSKLNTSTNSSSVISGKNIYPLTLQYFCISIYAISALLYRSFLSLPEMPGKMLSSKNSNIKSGLKNQPTPTLDKEP